jgi:hypothetical protein
VRIILKWILGTEYEVTDWIHVAQNINQWLGYCVYSKPNLPSILIKSGKLTRCEVRFSRSLHVASDTGVLIYATSVIALQVLLAKKSM